jgi:hypothetical protein
LNQEISEFFLIATGAFPEMGAVGSLLGLCVKNPVWGQAAARLGMIGSGLCGLTLAIVLMQNENPETDSIRVLLWTLFSFRTPRPLSLQFGFEANWLTAGLVGLAGVLFFLSEWGVAGQKQSPHSEDARLACSLLYATTTSFLFSPNLAQSLLSWGASSILIGILIRLSREKESKPLVAPPNRSEFNFPHRLDPYQGKRTASHSGNFPDSKENRLLQILSQGIRQISQQCDQIWGGVTNTFPGWLGEQSEWISDGSDSTKTLATVSGLFAILLTWLLIG